jgi:glyoxylase-like metal-dependent hydrolase (beta-lactamase superfamily II)
MRIADNVELLQIERPNGALNPVLTWDSSELVLIDACLPGQLGLLREAVEKAGFPLEKLTKVMLTHQDMDHIGCAKELSDMGAQILAHELEAPYITGEKKSVRLVQMEERLDQMDEAERERYESIKANAHLFYTPVDIRLKDGEVLDICGGIQAIHTPGHMPGHMALLLKQSNILVTGDAATIIDGVLIGANPKVTRYLDEAQASFEKMLAMKPAALVCYHGGYRAL